MHHKAILLRQKDSSTHSLSGHETTSRCLADVSSTSSRLQVYNLLVYSTQYTVSSVDYTVHCSYNFIS